jgi:hypothetical protein
MKNFTSPTAIEEIHAHDVDNDVANPKMADVFGNDDEDEGNLA